MNARITTIRMSSKVAVIVSVALAILLANAQSSFSAPPQNKPLRSPHVEVAPGYFLIPLATGLNFPTAIALSDNQIWISEAGHLPGVAPTVKEVLLDGSAHLILSPGMLPADALLGPLTDITYRQGWLWIAHRQVGVNGWKVGAISKFRPENPAGTFVTVISNLPSSGDHHSNEILFDGSGRAYFAQGTASNSGVVGADNWFVTQWLQNFPGFHDFAPVNIVLNGTSFQTQAPFPLDPTASLLTSPFMPFGTGLVASGTVIPAATPSAPQQGIIAGNGAVYSFDPATATPASTLRLEAWGLRNPFGLAIDPFNPSKLFVANNGADVRGVQGENATGDFVLLESRPIANDWDDLFVLDIGGAEEFYGWPDYFHSPLTGEVLPVTHPLFCASDATDIPCPPFVLDETFRNSMTVQAAFAQFELHSSANKFDFATDQKFKFVGDIFVAETGSFVPVSGAQEFVGYKVVRVDRRTGQVSDFIANRGRTPEERFDAQSFNKPIDVKFRGEFMFIVDFGVFEPGLMIQQPNSGKLWLVSHGMGNVARSRR